MIVSEKRKERKQTMQILAFLVVTVKAMSFAEMWDNSFANDTAMDNFLSDFKVSTLK